MTDFDRRILAPGESTTAKGFLIMNDGENCRCFYWLLAISTLLWLTQKLHWAKCFISFDRSMLLYSSKQSVGKFELAKTQAQIVSAFEMLFHVPLCDN